MSSVRLSEMAGYGLLLIAVRLTLQLVEHVGNWWGMSLVYVWQGPGDGRSGKIIARDEEGLEASNGRGLFDGKELLKRRTEVGRKAECSEDTVSFGGGRQQERATYNSCLRLAKRQMRVSTKKLTRLTRKALLKVATEQNVYSGEIM